MELPWRPASILARISSEKFSNLSRQSETSLQPCAPATRIHGWIYSYLYNESTNWAFAGFFILLILIPSHRFPTLYHSLTGLLSLSLSLSPISCLLSPNGGWIYNPKRTRTDFYNLNTLHMVWKPFFNCSSDSFTKNKIKYKTKTIIRFSRPSPPNNPTFIILFRDSLLLSPFFLFEKLKNTNTKTKTGEKKRLERGGI